MFYRTCPGLNNSQVLAELVSDLFFRRLAKKFFFADKSEKRRYVVHVKADYFFIGCKNADYAVIFSRSYSALRASGICSVDFFYIFLSEKINSKRHFAKQRAVMLKNIMRLI